MINVTHIVKLEDYQLRELETNQLYINKYDLDLKYDYEMALYWKEFFFDLLEEQASIMPIIIDGNGSLFDNLKKNYYNIIKESDLKIDFRDYIELNDYITFKEWQSLTGNFLVKTAKSFYLITIE